MPGRGSSEIRGRSMREAAPWVNPREVTRVTPRTRHPCRNIIARYLANMTEGGSSSTDGARSDDIPTSQRGCPRGPARSARRRRGLGGAQSPLRQCGVRPYGRHRARQFLPAGGARPVPRRGGAHRRELSRPRTRRTRRWSTMRSTSCFRASRPRTPAAIRPAASSITSCSTSFAMRRATRSAGSTRPRATSPMTASASPPARSTARPSSPTSMTAGRPTGPGCWPATRSSGSTASPSPAPTCSRAARPPRRSSPSAARRPPTRSR